MRPKSLLVLACCSFILLASPGLADKAKVEAKSPIATLSAPVGCSILTTGTPEPLFLTGCFVNLECADSSIVSCSGNTTCSTGGYNDRCVICDGVLQDCCPETCCEVCEDNFFACVNGCGLSSGCPMCNNLHSRCIAGCEGGCS
jgi:hypothetical protein